MICLKRYAINFVDNLHVKHCICLVIFEVVLNVSFNNLVGLIYLCRPKIVIHFQISSSYRRLRYRKTICNYPSIAMKKASYAMLSEWCDLGSVH